MRCALAKSVFRVVRELVDEVSKWMSQVCQAGSLQSTLQFRVVFIASYALEFSDLAPWSSRPRVSQAVSRPNGSAEPVLTRRNLNAERQPCNDASVVSEVSQQ